MNAAFWSGRKVFITGHTGFKGSWLALWLQRLGARVTGYALAPPTDPSLFEQARVATGMTSIVGDIRELDRLRAALVAAEPDVVLHLAAQSLVRLSYDEPVETYATNVLGTVHVLEAIRTVPTVRALVNVTTDKCYENFEWDRAYREDDRLGGRDPYSNSKACAELVTAAYRSSFFEHGHVAIASARAGNVIGGGDWAKDRIVPDAMRAFAAGRTLTVRNPASIRPWQHVLEPLAGYLLLAERLVTEGAAFARAWNFAPTDDLVLPVGELVAKLVAAWGPGAAWTSGAEVDAPHEAKLLRLDASLAHAQLGWQPALTIDAALEWIVEWHRAVAGGADARALCEAQLVRYSSPETR